MADDCGLLNLATCIPEKIYDFIIGVINAPIQPLLYLTKSLLTDPVDLSVLGYGWTVVSYILSLFYGLLLLYSGFNFMISGYDVVKRENAKEWIKNTILMIILVQLSYFVYSTFIDIGSLMTAGVINMVDQNFFLLTIDNITNLGLEFFFGILYALTLIFTVLLLAFRYFAVSLGVILAPLAIFLYFIPPVSDYGKLILNFLGVCIFITFFDSLVILACSLIADAGVFENFKILIMITCFNLINWMMFYFLIFSLFKSIAKSTLKTAFIVSRLIP